MTPPLNGSSRYKAMPDTNSNSNEDLLSNDYHKWDSHQLGLFFRRRGLSEYYETLQKHKITGQLAPLLNDVDLKEMGVDIVGDRLMFKHHLQDLSRRERYMKRIESLWEGEERIFFSDCDKLIFTIGGFCPVVSILFLKRLTRIFTNMLFYFSFNLSLLAHHIIQLS